METTAETAAEITGTKRHPCEGCYHWRGDFYKCCNYIFDMGHMRPCEPGENCTVWLDVTKTGAFEPWKE